MTDLPDLPCVVDQSKGFGERCLTSQNWTNAPYRELRIGDRIAYIRPKTPLLESVVHAAVTSLDVDDSRGSPGLLVDTGNGNVFIKAVETVYRPPRAKQGRSFDSGTEAEEWLYREGWRITRSWDLAVGDRVAVLDGQHRVEFGAVAQASFGRDPIADTGTREVVLTYPDRIYRKP